MTLKEYKRKRDFRVTPEPKGARRRQPGFSFVVQKHAARRLHYDFRLELDGVLKSWAVPKGPSLDPKNKRLAMQVEDHPVEYGAFEGIIPERQYGGGTVMLWDQGQWVPEGDPQQAYREGKLKFQLHGKKLRGGWMLVRRGGTRSPDEHAWFLIKELDSQARTADDSDVVDQSPASVTTGRSLNEIATDRDRVWNSATPAAKAERKKPRARRRIAKRKLPVVVKELPGSRRAAMPQFVAPQLATLTRSAPAGDSWLHEIKFDGYRMLARIDRGRARLISRNRQDWTERLAPVAEAVGRLPVGRAVLDGEVVALDRHGVSSFQALQNAQHERRTSELIYYVFDVLYLDGYDLSGLPLESRKKLLSRILAGAGDPLRYTEHVVADGPTFFQAACERHLEGIVSKRRDSPYSERRGADWLKIKCVRRDEFVIVGFTDPGGSRSHFGALLVGYYDDQQQLRYAGKVGTGFSDRRLKELHGLLKAIQRRTSPLAKVAGIAEPPRHVHWVEPRLVGQIEYSEWTRDGMLRQPSFLGLREDRRPEQVRRPVAIDPPSAASNGKAASPGAALASGRQSDGRRWKLTHPDRVLYPEQGITKAEMVGYYETVFDWMFPHLKNRPLVLVRCPEGRGPTCFYQKHAGRGTPENLRRVPIKEQGAVRDYVAVDDLAGLVSLVQMGVLEIHAWGSRIDRLDQPDRVVFDLDPGPGVDWSRVVDAACEVRQFLIDLGLTSFVKTTGGKGLHLVVPIVRRAEWPEIKQFCRAVALSIVTAAPKQYTATLSKAARPGKIFVDYLRNDAGATAVAAYSTRARPGAPVSVPLAWEELDPSIRSDSFTLENVPERLKRLRRDPWTDIGEVRQSITAKARKTVESAAKQTRR
jgi:bifunctional non-homologous end joining protein LigD